MDRLPEDLTAFGVPPAETPLRQYRKPVNFKVASRVSCPAALGAPALDAPALGALYEHSGCISTLTLIDAIERDFTRFLVFLTIHGNPFA